MGKYLGTKGFGTLWEQVKMWLSKKQDTLVSGQNLKTINGQSLLGTGNIVIKSGTGEPVEILNAEATAEESSTPKAVVTMENNVMRFSFGIPKGKNGIDGINGKDGAPGKDGKNGKNGIDGVNGKDGKDGKDGRNGIDGVNGRDGIDGLPGRDGKDGKDGKDGLTPILTKPCIIYKRSNDAPAIPIGGFWDIETGNIEVPSEWSLTYDEGDKSQTIWMSCTDFTSDTGKPIRDWSEPVIFQGKNGEPGKDGLNMEFIYCRTETTITPPLKPVSKNEDDYIPTGWTDNPQGITIKYQAEWVCTRTRTDKGWGNYNGPTLWSRWGVDGKDGDGVEYIYKRTDTGIAPATPVSDITSDAYQEDDYVPDGWTDNPTGVDSHYMWEWVCTRKTDKNNKWQAFEGGSANKSNAALWSKYGDKGDTGDGGYSIKTMYAKAADASEDLSKYLDRLNIEPGTIWSNKMPDYKLPEAIFGIQAAITFDNKLAYPEIGWQGPYLMTGVKGDRGTIPNWKTYIYKQSDTKPEKPEWNSPTPQGDWKDYPTSEGQWWQCIGEVNGVTNLVTSWSEILPVNGKDGEGKDGKRTEFRFKISDSATVAPGITTNDRSAGEGWSIAPPAVAFGKYLWMTTALINSNDSLSGTWTAPVRVSGESGRGVDVTTEYYMASPTNDKSKITTNGDDKGNTWKTTIDATTVQKRYLWNKEKTVYSDGSSTETDPHIIGMYSEDGKGIKSIVNWYMLNASKTGIKSGGVDGSTSGWSKTPLTPTDITPYQWNYEVVTYTDGSYTITDARVISLPGAKGDKGDIGPASTIPGPSGIPGVSIEMRYSVGTGDAANADSTAANLKKRVPSGWLVGLPAVTEAYPYIWIIQSRINYKQGENPTTEGSGTLATGSWSNPVRISGLNGLDAVGQQGKKGQVVYPAGIYDVNTAYTTDDKKAPYVYDTKGENFYVLNKIMTWKGSEQNNRYPSEDSTGTWEKFEMFNAVYAKIGIIPNGLIGSAVFNGDYMFSQQGHNSNGDAVSNYEDFDHDNPTRGSFIPNYCVNFRTGESWQYKANVEGDIVAKSLTTTLVAQDTATSIDESKLAIKFTDANKNPVAGFFTTGKGCQLALKNPDNGKWYVVDFANLQVAQKEPMPATMTDVDVTKVGPSNNKKTVYDIFTNKYGIAIDELSGNLSGDERGYVYQYNPNDKGDVSKKEYIYDSRYLSNDLPTGNTITGMIVTNYSSKQDTLEGQSTSSITCTIKLYKSGKLTMYVYIESLKAIFGKVVFNKFIIENRETRKYYERSSDVTTPNLYRAQLSDIFNNPENYGFTER